MLRAFKQYILAQQYNPGVMGLWFNPLYHARRGLYQAIAEMAPRLAGCLLDVGCGIPPLVSGD